MGGGPTRERGRPARILSGCVPKKLLSRSESNAPRMGSLIGSCSRETSRTVLVVWLGIGRFVTKVSGFIAKGRPSGPVHAQLEDVEPVVSAHHVMNLLGGHRLGEIDLGVEEAFLVLQNPADGGFPPDP